MKNLHEKVNDLKELCTGLNQDTKEGKVILAVIDTLADFAEELARLETAAPYGLKPESGGSFFCPNCHEPIDIEESALDEEEHVICPKCYEPILISSNEI